jgi:hypothetical protein
MIKKPKISKIAIVVFLTVLIWVWADLAQDDRLPLLRLVRIAVAETGDPLTWIVFKKEESDAPKRLMVLESVDLKGPVRNINEVRRMKEKGTLDLAIYLDPKQAGMEGDGSYRLDVLSLLQKDNQIKQRGLTVENCEPRVLTVQVQHLVEKPINVQVVDADDHPISTETVDPAQVMAPVPDGEVRTAKVLLTSAEQQRAKVVAISKTPFIELAPGQSREVSKQVKIKLPSEEETKKAWDVHATLGICFSPILQGKYQVKLQNEDAFATVSIRATAAAEQEFEKQAFNIILYIHDSDADKPGTDIEREVVFNFPPDYAGRGEIKEGSPLKKAKFTLVPVTPENKPAASN